MPDRIPTPAEIASLSTAELRLLAQRLGVSQAHVAQVTEAVRRATSRLIGANLPSDALVKAVTEATDRAIRRELQAVTRDLIRQAQAREHDITEDSRERWIAVMDEATCEDCEARHGHEQTHAEWEDDGLPGSKNTICNGRCRCELMPADMFDTWTTQATKEQIEGLPSEERAQERGDVQVSVSLEVA